MANIKEYLDQIRSAIYGEEVRGSIVNAITAMNNESSQAKTEATSAAEQARASANAAKTSETKATQAQMHAAKIDRMTVSASKLNAGATPTVSVSDDGTKKHLTFGIPKGDTGVTPNISMTVSTGTAGSNASVTKSGTAENPTFALTIPRGNTGAKGPIGNTPNISVKVNTGTAGSNASVAKSGTAENPILTFTIPRGNTGAIPTISAKAINGEAGTNASVAVSGTDESPVLTFTIPRGDKGDKGDPGPMPKLTIGTVTTGAPGTSASATLTGTAAEPVLNMTIPEGQRGVTEGVPLTDIPAKDLGEVASAGTSNEVARSDHVHKKQESISGNAGTATKLQNARDIDITGKITGRAYFDGSKNVEILTAPRYCYAGRNNSKAPSNLVWFKFAELLETESHRDHTISFKVYTGYASRDTKLGILTAHFRIGDSLNVDNATLIWEYASNEINISDFVMAYNKNDDGSSLKVELWLKSTITYMIYRFIVLNEGDRLKEEIRWNLLSADVEKGAEAISNGFVQVPSALSVLQNPTVSAVSFKNQSLTEEQKAQARANIGAGEVTSVNGQTGDVIIQASEGGPALSNAIPKPLATTAESGTSVEAARADHAHEKPTPTEISAVAFTTQILTEEQKAQARSNIGAGLSTFSGSYNDLTNKPNATSLSAVSFASQTLNDAQKQQARTNIGAGTSSFSGNYSDLQNKPSLFSGSYNDLENKPTIPSKTSQLQNDSGYLTSAPVTSVNGQTGDVVISAMGGGGSSAEIIYDGYTSVTIGETVINLTKDPKGAKFLVLFLEDGRESPVLINPPTSNSNNSRYSFIPYSSFSDPEWSANRPVGFLSFKITFNGASFIFDYAYTSWFNTTSDQGSILYTNALETAHIYRMVAVY